MSMQRDAIDALLARSRRGHVPIRRALLQTRPADGDRSRHVPVGGPLSAFGKREAALDLYLLARAVASKAPWDVSLSNRVWARLLGASEDASGSTHVARQWAWLEQQQLVSSTRDGRNRRIVLLREDGSGRPYSHPGLWSDGGRPEGDYFQLPYSYWRLGWDARLSMAGKLVLLISLSLQDDFILPVQHAASWYSLGATRINNGLNELRAADLLAMRVERRAAPLTDRGHTFERHYAVKPPLRVDPAQVLLDAMRHAIEAAPEHPLFEHTDNKIVQLGVPRASLRGSRDLIRAMDHAGLVMIDRGLAPRWVFRLATQTSTGSPPPR